MKLVSTSYEASGRAAQKQRTRQALLDATRALLARGVTPSLEDVATAASVSRATAYRYFPDQRALLVAAHPEIDATTMLPDDVPDDAGARLDAAVSAFIAMIVETEAQQRAMLRLALDDDRSELPLRQGRAIGWFTEALEGLRDELGEDGLRRLVLAVRATTGIESLVWLTDIGGLSRADAAELMAWSARALVRQAVEDPPPAGRPDRRRRR
jgi:AcrR family transcriptional regulator